MKEEVTKRKTPGMLAGGIALAIIVVSIVVSIKLQFGTQMSVFVGAVVAVLVAMVMKTKWSEIQEEALAAIAKCGVPLLILTLVGILVGIWLIGGTLPTLIYYGLSFISPRAVVPLTFILCALTSVFTGTSYGSIATMGLAMFGIGVNLGIPGTLMAGAVVSGSYFGDKMSPMSDTTNVAPAMSGTDLYSHIHSMLYTTVPATLVVLILYVVLGLRYSNTAFDSSTIELMKSTLSANYNLHIICLVPLVLVLVLAACKVPSVLAMGISAVVSIVIAALTQGVAVKDIMTVALNGYTSETGVDMIDTILSRGGIKSMTGIISIIFFSGIMAGALRSAGILTVFEELLLKMVKSVRSLIVTTLVFGWGMVALTGNQMLGIIIPGQTMGEVFDKMNVHRKVLSRSLEDSATIGSAIIPWSAATAYITGVLGVGIGFIPYALLCYIVPIFSIICAFTGIGIWDKEGKAVWKKTEERGKVKNEVSLS